MSLRALVIDHDPASFSVLAPIFAKAGFTADSAGSAESASALFTPRAHRVVIVDPASADLAKLAPLFETSEAYVGSGPAVLIMRGRKDPPLALEPLSTTVLDCLDKPLVAQIIERRLARVMQLMELEKNLHATEATLAAAWGTDSDMGVGTYGALQRALEVEFARARIRNLPLTCMVVAAVSGSAHSPAELEAHHAHLRDFVEKFQNKLRQADHIFRVDDAEFVVLLPGTHAAGARRVVKTLSEIEPQEQVAVGVAVYPHPDLNQAAGIYRAANLSLVQAQLAAEGARVSYFEGF